MMDPRSPSFEASLLYKSVQQPNIDELISQISDLLASQGVAMIYAEKVNSVFTLLTCDTVEILLAFTDKPMAVEHFLDSNLPASTNMTGPQMLERLKAHTSSATVLVVDREDADVPFGQPHEDLKRTICWEISEFLHTATSPELVFWCDTDTLYSEHEFGHTCPVPTRRLFTPKISSPQISAPQHDLNPSPKIPAYFREEPVAEGAARAWMNGQFPTSEIIYEPISESPDRPALDTMMSLALPNWVALQFDNMQANFSLHRTINGIAMACATATIGISGPSGVAMLFI